MIYIRMDSGKTYNSTIVLSAICFIWFQFLHSQNQITFRQLSVKEGLSQNSAISIAQDSTGYLWVATQDGLNKYDGRQFEVYPYAFEDVTKPDYSHLGKIYVDRQGGLWTIPLNRVPRKLNTKTNSFEPLAGVSDASALYQDENLDLWIGTFASGLLLHDAKTNTVAQILAADELPTAVYALSENEKGNLVLATNNAIFEIDIKSKKTDRLNPTNIYGDTIRANISDVVFDSSARQWIGTFGDGLYFRENAEITFQRISTLAFSDPLPSDLNILDLHVDSQQRLWIATYGRGLYMVDFAKFKIVHFNAEKHNPRALHYNDILCIYEDYSGTLWFGTDGAGVSYYDEYLEKFNSLTNFQTPENISIDVVRSIEVDDNNSVWIGTSGKGLTQYEPDINSWRTFKTEAGKKNTISSDRIMSLLVDEENALWIGTQENGLDIRKPNGTFVNYSKDTEIPLAAKTIWNIFRDGKNRYWLGTREQGLVQFDKEKGVVRQYVRDPDNERSIPSNNIRVITEDDKGDLWIGTEVNGLSHFDLEKETFVTYKNLPNANSLSNDNLKSLYHDKKGILWIGTNGGGLNAFDADCRKFYNYTVKDGLANDVIYGILPDAEGNLWLSSNKGITKFTSGNSLEDPPSIVNYNNYDGLATEFNTGAHHIDKNGNLYFGGLDGFYWFKPDEIKENTILPKTTITKFEVSNETRAMTEQMKLKHNENTVNFTFSSLQYSLPEKNLYQYKLLNYDADWVQAGNTNFARYSFLPPGKYEFQVKSSNYDGVWNERPISYKFVIAAPWYLTTLAKFVYGLLFLTLAYAIYRYLKWRWKVKLDLQMREEEAERLKRVNDFKSKLYTDISHEFRTPLTLISGPVDSKLGEGGLSDTDFSNFSMIKRNTNRLTSLVDQLLHLAKLEKGKLKLNLSQGNLGHFLNMLANSFEYKAELKKMNYTVNIAATNTVWYDEDALEKIVTNLLSNAFKYSPDGGLCQFDAAVTDEKLQISIKNSVDDSSSIQVEKLFVRFYQQDEYAEGAGVGLSLVKELVNLYKGSISATTEDDRSIRFKVTLPLKKASFDPEDFVESTEKRTEDIEVIPEILKNGHQSVEGEEPKDLPILLIVEDHKEVRSFVASVWKDKYQVYEAENGKIGIDKALEVIPDLIITDVRMPVCDGIELCNRLKTDERTSHIPIVLLTAGIGEESELRGLQSGADDFITKPFKLRVLQKRVENLIETRKALRNRYSQELVLKAKDIAITPTDEVFLNRLQDVLDTHLSDPDFNTETFCKAVGMSRMQLHRKLMAYTGLSTTAFIRSQRLKQAVHILKTSDATINEVAYTVGFNTPSYFIRCFKEVYKKTPAEYLQSIN